MKITGKLTNLQVELLKMFQYDLEESQLEEIKELLANYFAQKVTEEMDKLWEEHQWNDETMKKIGFKIYLNDRLISVSGINADGVVSQILTLRNDSENNEQSIKLHSGGYLKEANEHYKWVDQVLQENDKVTIEVVEDIEFDDPIEIKPHDNPDLNAFVLKSKLKSYYQLKEELKDHLKE